ncbi:MAG TPA: MerR family transcriptional regulator [Pirellulales bacterium]|nr:MerR family transcriptional regulator [Pirellulales bacterium]
MQPRWKIAELAEVAGRALANAGQHEQPSARVRDVPDLRTIRYYTTLGILDRPLEMQGRTAYYGRRHLWQLLAIKRLQAEGATLVQIQERLAGADDRSLKKLANLPARLAFGERTADNGKPSPVPEATRKTFWADAAAVSPASVPSAQASPSIVQSALHVNLAEGVTLVIEGVEQGACSADTLAALEAAARGATRGLVKQLRRLGFTAAQEGTGYDPSHSTVGNP